MQSVLKEQNMNWNEFLEMNGQLLSDEEWENLNDVDHAQVAHIED